MTNPPAVGHPRMVITYNPRTSLTSIQGPLANFALVDRMLCDARRIATQYYMDARYQQKDGQIKGATLQEVKELTG